MINQHIHRKKTTHKQRNITQFLYTFANVCTTIPLLCDNQWKEIFTIKFLYFSGLNHTPEWTMRDSKKKTPAYECRADELRRHTIDERTNAFVLSEWIRFYVRRKVNWCNSFRICLNYALAFFFFFRFFHSLTGVNVMKSQ